MPVSKLKLFVYFALFITYTELVHINEHTALVRGLRSPLKGSKGSQVFKH